MRTKAKNKLKDNPQKHGNSWKVINFKNKILHQSFKCGEPACLAWESAFEDFSQDRVSTSVADIQLFHVPKHAKIFNLVNYSSV